MHARAIGMVLLADVVLAGALFLAVPRFGDGLFILAGWGLVMAGIAIAGALRRRSDVGVLQLAVAVAVLVFLAPAL
ncbi:hypothetical protein ACQP1P_12480 [Dactylosporangium sp. CA-052675]|uniref:hypothetical protein n=1 Tax=Dactylosporangium sp. CA-052675 TaxID=3239927 RepID=UPI003D8A2609